MEEKSIKSPWTDEQVKALNEFQKLGFVHEYTCGGKNCKRSKVEDNRVLVATNNGWVCPCGEYKQDWAQEHAFHPEVMKARRIAFLSKNNINP